MRLTDQQRYIEALRAEAKTASIRYETEREELEADLFSTRAGAGIVIALLVCGCVWMGLANLSYSDQVQALTNAQREDTDLQQRFDNVVEDWHYQSKRATDLTTELEICEAGGVK